MTDIINQINEKFDHVLKKIRKLEVVVEDIYNNNLKKEEKYGKWPFVINEDLLGPRTEDKIIKEGNKMRNSLYFGNEGVVVNLDHVRYFIIVPFPDNEIEGRFKYFLDCITDQGRVTVSTFKGEKADEDASEALCSIQDQGLFC